MTYDEWKLTSPYEDAPGTKHWAGGSDSDPMPEYLRDEGDLADEAREREEDVTKPCWELFCSDCPHYNHDGTCGDVDVVARARKREEG